MGERAPPGGQMLNVFGIRIVVVRIIGARAEASGKQYMATKENVYVC